METFLNELRQSLADDSPHLLELFDIFAQEARAARRWLAPNLDHLPAGSPILEVGAGLMLLSCELQREGYSVTALEPIGAGFFMFRELQGRVLTFAAHRGIKPQVLSLPVENLEIQSYFRFAFSVNVMEHVGNVPAAIGRIGNALAVGGEYRFTCPNYWFPYEPHFNIPTLFSKRLTGIVFAGIIGVSKRVSDPLGTWESLNWISVYQIRKTVSRLKGFRLTFCPDQVVRTLERVGTDMEFASRRSASMRKIVNLSVRLGLHRLAGLIPTLFQPIIDCCVSRVEEQGV